MSLLDFFSTESEQGATPPVEEITTTEPLVETPGSFGFGPTPYVEEYVEEPIVQEVYEPEEVYEPPTEVDKPGIEISEERLGTTGETYGTEIGEPSETIPEQIQYDIPKFRPMGTPPAPETPIMRPSEEVYVRPYEAPEFGIPPAPETPIMRPFEEAYVRPYEAPEFGIPPAPETSMVKQSKQAYMQREVSDIDLILNEFESSNTISVSAKLEATVDETMDVFVPLPTISDKSIRSFISEVIIMIYQYRLIDSDIITSYFAQFKDTGLMYNALTLIELARGTNKHYDFDIYSGYMERLDIILYTYYNLCDKFSVVNMADMKRISYYISIDADMYSDGVVDYPKNKINYMEYPIQTFYYCLNDLLRSFEINSNTDLISVRNMYYSDHRQALIMFELNAPHTDFINLFKYIHATTKRDLNGIPPKERPPGKSKFKNIEQFRNDMPALENAVRSLSASTQQTVQESRSQGFSPQQGTQQQGGFRPPQQGTQQQGVSQQQQGGFRPPQQGTQQQGGFRPPQQGTQQQGGFRPPQQQGGQQGGFSPQQQGGFSPPQQQGGFSPPQQQGGFSPPQQGTPSPSQGGFRPPQQQGGFRPPQQGTPSPSQGGFSPKQQGGFSPKQQGGFSPKQQGGFSPQQQGGQQGGFSPQQQGGQQGGFRPPQQGTPSPSQGGFSPQQQGSQQGGFRPPQQGTQQQGGYTQGGQQGGFSPQQQGGFSPQQQGGFSPQQQGGFSPQQQGGFSPQQQGGQQQTHTQAFPGTYPGKMNTELIQSLRSMNQ